MALEPKQQRFVDEYLLDLNATAAAKRAGYKQPHVQGPRLLANARVQEAVTAAKAQRADVAGVDAARVINEYIALSFNDLRSIFVDSPEGEPLRLKPLKEWPESVGRSLASVKVKSQLEKDENGFHPVEIIEFKVCDKLGALRDLAKHAGVLKESVEHKHTGADGGPVRHEHKHDYESLRKLPPDELARLYREAVEASGEDAE